MAKLYRKQLAKVKVAGTLSECFVLRKESDRLCPFSVLVQHYSGDGDEGDSMDFKVDYTLEGE